jgi:hypothetical protein
MDEQGPPNVIQATVPGDWPTVAAVAIEIAQLLILAHSDEQGPLQGHRRTSANGRTSASAMYRVNVSMSAVLAEELSALEKANTPTDILLGEIEIGERGDEVHVAAIVAAPEYRPYWALVIQRIQSVFQSVGYIRRKLLGETFKEIIEEYYARHKRGERVKLKDLSEAAGVNYDSLRQAKFRYDEQKRKM